MDAPTLAPHIEHAILSPQATDEDLRAAVRTATRWNVRTLVVKPCHVAAAARLLAGTKVTLATVIGFPHGGQTTEVKAFETRRAIEQGAREVDMVLDLGALRACNLIQVLHDIRSVVEAAGGRPVKVILETAYLEDWHKRLACRLAARAGAAYVKTSTGFAPRGATVEDVALMRRTVGQKLGVKAAGGIRTYTEAVALLEAGADLIGTSQTEAILAEAAQKAA
jgi:deoxyribose-phosphate aldolase